MGIYGLGVGGGYRYILIIQLALLFIYLSFLPIIQAVPILKLVAEFSNVEFYLHLLPTAVQGGKYRFLNFTTTNYSSHWHDHSHKQQ